MKHLLVVAALGLACAACQPAPNTTHSPRC